LLQIGYQVLDKNMLFILSLKRLVVAFALACTLPHAPLAFAAYPEKSLRLIVPFAPGGGTDQMARSLGAGLTKVLGQTVVIENKPGAGTVIGMDLVARVLLMVTPLWWQRLHMR